MADKDKSVLTPRVIAVYPKITSPDTRGKKADGKYKTQFKFEEDEDCTKFQGWLKKKAKELCPDLKKPKMPWTLPTDDDEKPTGEVWFRASSKYKPLIVDSKNKDIKPGINISGGSVMRLFIGVGSYEDGICLYLNQVQLIKLVEWKPTSAFDEVEDGFGDDGDGEESGGEKGADDFGAESKDDDESIPF